MLLALGLLCLALSIGFGICAFKSKPKRGSRHIRLMPLFFVLTFISFLASLAFIVGGGAVRVSVSVYGSLNDRALYQRLVSTSERRYKFYTLNEGQRGPERPAAYSCNISQMQDFIKSTKNRSGIDIVTGTEEKCAEQGALSNLFKPHIDLYLSY